jgi:dihydrofolate reductase
MGKIIVSENVTLDGVVQDPTGDEGSGHGGWFFQIGDADREAWAKVELDEALAAEALLLGRRTDEWFATRWLSRTGEWADRLNGMPKYVVSSTLQEPTWSNATAGFKGSVLRGVDEVTKLKDELNGDLVVYASRPLVHALMENGLVDELRLTVYPIVLGTGARLFAETDTKPHPPLPLRLVKAQTLGAALIHLTYQPVRST